MASEAVRGVSRDALRVFARDSLGLTRIGALRLPELQQAVARAIDSESASVRKGHVSDLRRLAKARRARQSRHGPPLEPTSPPAPDARNADRSSGIRRDIASREIGVEAERMGDRKSKQAAVTAQPGNVLLLMLPADLQRLVWRYTSGNDQLVLKPLSATYCAWLDNDDSFCMLTPPRKNLGRALNSLANSVSAAPAAIATRRETELKIHLLHENVYSRCSDMAKQYYLKEYGDDATLSTRVSSGPSSASSGISAATTTAAAATATKEAASAAAAASDHRVSIHSSTTIQTRGQEDAANEFQCLAACERAFARNLAHFLSIPHVSQRFWLDGLARVPVFSFWQDASATPAFFQWSVRADGITVQWQRLTGPSARRGLRLFLARNGFQEHVQSQPSSDKIAYQLREPKIAVWAAPLLQLVAAFGSIYVASIRTELQVEASPEHSFARRQDRAVSAHLESLALDIAHSVHLFGSKVVRLPRSLPGLADALAAHLRPGIYIEEDSIVPLRVVSRHY